MHLLWQLNLTPMTDRDRIIALAIVDAVAPSGFLEISAEDIYQGLLEQWQDEDVLECDEVLAVFNTFGSPANSAIQRYMNIRKVPQLFLATSTLSLGLWSATNDFS